MNIKVRADGGAKIGLGHWSRCLFLMSCSGGNAILYTRNAAEFSESFPAAEIQVTGIGSEDQFVDTVSPGDVIILDVYNYPEAYAEKLSVAGALIIYIDDFDSAPFADVIINQGPGLTPDQYRNAPVYATFLLGNRFSLVSPEFKEAKTASDVNRTNHLLIAMGGADPLNHTCRIVDQVMGEKKFDTVDVIIGPQFKHQKELNDRAVHTTGINVHTALSKDKIARIMQACGVAIVSASTMAQEYAHCRGLLAIELTADNQKNLFDGLLSMGMAIRADRLLATERSAYQVVFNDLISTQRIMFDGLSRERFSKLFAELDLQTQVSVRVARAEDNEKTFQWATDSTIRAFSFSKATITREGHNRWFEQKISDVNCLYLIAELNGEPIGSIRFDRVGTDLVVSYLIDSSVHGRGLGRILLVKGMKQLHGEWLAAKRVIGYVIATNTPSVRIFARLGFQQEDGGNQFPGSIRFYKTL